MGTAHRGSLERKRSRRLDSSTVEEPRSVAPNDFRLALGLFGGVVGTAVGLLVVAIVLDLQLGALTSDTLFAAVRSEGLANSMGSLAEVLAAVLGVSLTVVAIVVQLASARYPAKIVDLFMFDRVNVAVIGFMAVSCVYVTLIPLLAVSEPPLIATGIGVTLAVMCFGLLLPYFAHVFAFLEPTNIITQIENRAFILLAIAADRQLAGEELLQAQQQTAAAVERIADNCMAAVTQSDRNLALHSVRSLETVVTGYLAVKPRLPAEWAHVDRVVFGTLAQEFVDEIVAHGTWLEAKTLMEYERVSRRALAEMSEVVSQLASSTRQIGLAAVAHGDEQVVDLTVRFFNTYIRHGLNARNVRAVYNILYEYRRLAVEVYRWNAEAGRRVVEHLVYYGRTANDLGMPFVTVTCAHDVRVICQEIYGDHSGEVDELLKLFLTLDQPSEHKSEEVALIGVRKAQSILGAFFLQQSNKPLTELIRRDMRHENRARLTAIRDEILAVKERKFWEITDRGHNFDYVDDELRPHLDAFFAPML